MAERPDSQTFVSDAAALAAEQVRRHPYAALGTAAAAGYVLGGGVPRFIVSAVVGTGIRYALGQAFSQLLGTAQDDQS